MNFFSKKTSWSNAELVLLKICILSAGLIAGTLFHDALRDYILYLVPLLGFTAAISLLLWISKLRS